eukprot:TRINITY_DN8428_c0_g1_i1.p1 TRINITY_DN8428_c0_g1~~TRINITY_DN8428_c0_g1_i1.p1  ORF type:complete len:363 (+),score=61.27 TRINITY_DN8428_c0_g1_i1:82-1170(+)
MASDASPVLPLEAVLPVKKTKKKKLKKLKKVPEDPLPLQKWELGVPTDDLQTHFGRLSQRSTEDPDDDGFDLEFNFIEQKSDADSFFGDYDTALRADNRAKNRYTNVLPLEATRVHIKGDPEDAAGGEGYINANWVDGLIPGTTKTYISCQGPLQDTVEDFWQMVWQTNSNVIAMLTRLIENGRPKCAQYWPADVGNAFTFSNLRVTFVNEIEKKRTMNREFLLEDLVEGKKRKVMHFQYMDWPDHGLPESSQAFRTVLKNVDLARDNNAPIVVHCSAGIGRTGTFCTVHSILAKLEAQKRDNPGVKPEFNILKTVLRMREQRVGMVQTKEQYMFCYKALIEATTQTPPDAIPTSANGTKDS